jgi:hypothetical protein
MPFAEDCTGEHARPALMQRSFRTRKRSPEYHAMPPDAPNEIRADAVS